MKQYLITALSVLGLLLAGIPGFAQSQTVTARLVEESSGGVPHAGRLR